MADALFQRLQTIRHLIDAGEVDPLTSDQWNQLSDIVTVVMDAARDAGDALARERYLRIVIEKLANDHGWTIH